MGVEHAKDKTVADLKEFWQIGRTLDPGHDLHRSGEVPAKCLSKRGSGLRRTVRSALRSNGELRKSTPRCCGELSRPRARVLSRKWSAKGTAFFGSFTIRLCQSKSLTAVRAAQHEDINLITVLPASTEGGLELLNRNGDWVPVSPPAGVMVCDTGDMMALLTGNRLPATTHRVVNPPGDAARRSRYSMPFFVHPGPGERLNPNATHGEAPIYARDFLQKRLEEIGVTKG